MKTVFIGAGKMATAIVKGVVNNKIIPQEEIAAVDISEDARRNFTEITGVQCYESPDDILMDCEIVVLAVKPQYAETAAKNIAEKCKDKLIISIAAGVTLNSLEEWFACEKIARTMPNTPLMVGCGASVFAAASGVNEEDKKIISSLFEASGVVFEVQESLIDAVTAVSGSGPAYLFEMIDAMTQAGVKCGLPEELALTLTAQTVKGAGEMILQKIGTPCELRTAVTSPGGTTEAGLKVMEGKHFRELIYNVVQAAMKRSIELGQSKS
jgi:pyrroline-5-carboxylate reductase